MAWRRRTRRQSSWSRREPSWRCTCRGAAATGRRPHATPNWPRGTSWRATSPAPSHAGRSDRGSSGGLCRRNRILGGGFGRGAKPPSEVLARWGGESFEDFFELLLVGAVGGEVAAAQRVLGAREDLQRASGKRRRRRHRLRGRGGPGRRRRGRRRGAASADAQERLLQRWLHGDLVAVGHDDPPELGKRALLGGGQVGGLDVGERLNDRDGEKGAADDRGASLVPRGRLRRR